MTTDVAPVSPIFSDDTPESAPLSSAPSTDVDAASVSPSPVPAGADEAPSASGDSSEVKRRRGERGPDKTPRGPYGKRPRARKDGHAAMNDTAPPVSPFSDPVDGPVIEGSPAQTADAPPPRPRGHAGKPRVKMQGGNATVDIGGMMGMKPEELGALAVSVGSAIIVQVAAKRYGVQEAAATFAMAPEDQKTFAALTGKVIEEKGLTMTPSEALMVMLTLYYGVRIMSAETARIQKAKERDHVARPVAA